MNSFPLTYVTNEKLQEKYDAKQENGLFLLLVKPL